jgi:hypothetical protein
MQTVKMQRSTMQRRMLKGMGTKKKKSKNGMEIRIGQLRPILLGMLALQTRNRRWTAFRQHHTKAWKALARRREWLRKAKVTRKTILQSLHIYTKKVVLRPTTRL